MRFDFLRCSKEQKPLTSCCFPALIDWRHLGEVRVSQKQTRDLLLHGTRLFWFAICLPSSCSMSHEGTNFCEVLGHQITGQSALLGCMLFTWSTLVPGTRWHNHSPTCCVFENLGIPPKIFDDFKSSVQSCKRRPPYLRLSRNNLWRSYLLDGISMLCYKWTVA